MDIPGREGKVSVDLDLVFDTMEMLGYELHARIRREGPTEIEEAVAALTHKPGRTKLTAGGAPLRKAGWRRSRSRGKVLI
jgi:hypothetical protein